VRQLVQFFYLRFYHLIFSFSLCQLSFISLFCIQIYHSAYQALEKSLYVKAHFIMSFGLAGLCFSHSLRIMQATCTPNMCYLWRRLKPLIPFRPFLTSLETFLLHSRGKLSSDKLSVPTNLTYSFSVTVCFSFLRTKSFT